MRVHTAAAFCATVEATVAIRCWTTPVVVSNRAAAYVRCPTYIVISTARCSRNALFSRNTAPASPSRTGAAGMMNEMNCPSAPITGPSTPMIPPTAAIRPPMTVVRIGAACWNAGMSIFPTESATCNTAGITCATNSATIGPIDPTNCDTSGITTASAAERTPPSVAASDPTACPMLGRTGARTSKASFSGDRFVQASRRTGPRALNPSRIGDRAADTFPQIDPKSMDPSDFPTSIAVSRIVNRKSTIGESSSRSNACPNPFVKSPLKRMSETPLTPSRTLNRKLTRPESSSKPNRFSAPVNSPFASTS